MPKFKILVTMDKLSGEDVTEGIEEWSQIHHVGFESRAEATTAYHALIAQQENKVNEAQETLNALVENGHIVEVEEDG